MASLIYRLPAKGKKTVYYFFSLSWSLKHLGNIHCYALNRIHQRGRSAGRANTQETTVPRHVLTESQVPKKAALSRPVVTSDGI